MVAPSAQPVFNQRPGRFFSKKTFRLLSMLGTSYIAHFNAPKFYSELENPTVTRYNIVVVSAFMIAMCFFSLIMSVGFLTFGGNSLGLILNNYASSDAGASFARLAIGGAILTSYPFAFSALIDGILDLQEVSGDHRSKLIRPYTAGLLTFLTAVALVSKDVGFVNGLSGALFGCLLLMVLPALMNIKNMHKKFGTYCFGKPSPRDSYGLGNRIPPPFTSVLESILNYAMIPSGIALTAISVIEIVKEAV
jgi:amino acid permease